MIKTPPLQTSDELRALMRGAILSGDISGLSSLVELVLDKLSNAQLSAQEWDKRSSNIRSLWLQACVAQPAALMPKIIALLSEISTPEYHVDSTTAERKNGLLGYATTSAAHQRCPACLQALVSHGLELTAPTLHSILGASIASGVSTDVLRWIAVQQDSPLVQNPARMSPFFKACHHDRGDSIRALAAFGLDINAPAPITARSAAGPMQHYLGGYTPLMAACFSNSAIAGTALIECGADLDAISPQGMDALAIAVECCAYELADAIRMQRALLEKEKIAHELLGHPEQPRPRPVARL